VVSGPVEGNNRKKMNSNDRQTRSATSRAVAAPANQTVEGGQKPQLRSEAETNKKVKKSAKKHQKKTTEAQRG
jgi:hypothetical protein